MIQFSKDIIKAQKSNLSEQLKLLDKIYLSPLYESTFNSKQFRTREGLHYIVSKIPVIHFPIIYQLSCNNPKQRTKLLETFKLFHAENRKRQLRTERINTARFNDTKSACLYVGSTVNSFKNRLTQHLGGANYRIYALQLSKWDNELNYDIQIQALTVQTKGNVILNRPFIELIEQAYWDKLLPVFGKRGGL